MTEQDGTPLWSAEDNLPEFDASQPWSASNHPWMRASQIMYERLRAENPELPEVDDPDPMIRIATLTQSMPMPPHKFWDTTEMWERAQQEYMHPYTLWAISSASAAEISDPDYSTWLDSRYDQDRMSEK